MGMIKIEVGGSFRNTQAVFSAMDGGHADAVSQAIEWLAAHVLPDAIAQDHKLASQGEKPAIGFGHGREKRG